MQHPQSHASTYDEVGVVARFRALPVEAKTAIDWSATKQNVVAKPSVTTPSVTKTSVSILKGVTTSRVMTRNFLVQIRLIHGVIIPTQTQTLNMHMMLITSGIITTSNVITQRMNIMRSHTLSSIMITTRLLLKWMRHSVMILIGEIIKIW